MTHHAPSQFSRAGRVYLAAVIVGGLAAIAGSSWSLYSRAVGPQWLLVAVLTVISSSISLKMPSVPASVSISETFLFASIILFGPAAGTLTVAIDGLVISVWMERSRRQPSRLLFNVAAPAISIWAAAHVLYASAHLVPTGIGSTPLDSLLLPLVLCALTYFALNTGLIAVAVSHETGLSPFAVWREHFAWLSLNYFAGASLALLLVAYTRHL
ncbi:MAG TPA: hypothetical protein VND92_00605, partial [Vicinamibacterales bacterium]|nr:hypothetical protein [Vicinamibacterales bacterium]